MLGRLIVLRTSSLDTWSVGAGSSPSADFALQTNLRLRSVWPGNTYEDRSSGEVIPGLRIIFFKVEISSCVAIPLFRPGSSTVAKRAETTVAECSLISCV